MVECLAANYAVAVVVRSTVGASEQMLDGSLSLGEWLTTEETLASLSEQQTVEMRGHFGNFPRA